MMRRGSAGSKTTADHIAICDEAIAALPPAYRRRVMVTCDGAGASHGLIEHLDTLARRPGYQLVYSVGWDLRERERHAIGWCRNRCGRSPSITAVRPRTPRRWRLRQHRLRPSQVGSNKPTSPSSRRRCATARTATNSQGGRPACACSPAGNGHTPVPNCPCSKPPTAGATACGPPTSPPAGPAGGTIRPTSTPPTECTPALRTASAPGSYGRRATVSASAPALRRAVPERDRSAVARGFDGVPREPRSSPSSVCPGRSRCPRWDSNPDCADFKSAASTAWATGASDLSAYGAAAQVNRSGQSTCSDQSDLIANR